MKIKPKYAFSILRLTKITGFVAIAFAIFLLLFLILLNNQKNKLAFLEHDYFRSKQMINNLNTFSNNLSTVSLYYSMGKDNTILNYYNDIERSYRYNTPFYWNSYHINYYLLEQKLPYTKKKPLRLKNELEKIVLTPEIKSHFYDAYYLIKKQINAENTIISLGIDEQNNNNPITIKSISHTLDSIEIDTLFVLDTMIIDTLHHKHTIINQQVLLDSSYIPSYYYFYQPKYLYQKLKLYDKLFTLSNKIETYYTNSSNKYKSNINTITNLLYIILFSSIILVSLFTTWGIKHVSSGLNLALDYLTALKNGEKVNINENIPLVEIIKVEENIKSIEKQKVDLTEFANNIGAGNLDYEFSGIKDSVGDAMLKMRDELRKLVNESNERQLKEQKDNWVNESLAKFNEILRKSDSEDKSNFHMSVLKQILKSLDANQGGIFVTKEDKNGLYFELMASYAYDIERKNKKQIRAGKGVLGNIIYEKNPIYLDKLPENYLELTSGIGKTTPKYLYIQPLLVSAKIEGVIELASFKPIENHHRKYLQRVGENLASVMATMHSQYEMKILLEQSKIQHDTLATQEEELRQNLEELSATQEEISRKENDMKKIELALNNGLLRVDMNSKGRLLSANPLFLKAFSVSFLEMSGSNFTLYLNRELEEIFSIKWKNLIRKKAGFTLEGYFQLHSERHYVIGTLQPILNSERQIQKIIFMGLIPTKNIG